MKILTTNKIDRIDNLTDCIHEFINNLPNDSIKKPIEKIDAIHRLNEVRGILGLSGIIRLNSRRPLLSTFAEINVPLPLVKPCKNPEHEHDFFTAHQTATGVTICCRTCGEIRRIEANLPQEKKTPEYIKISIDDFNNLCNSVDSVAGMKEMLLEWGEMQEDKQ